MQQAQYRMYYLLQSNKVLVTENMNWEDLQTYKGTLKKYFDQFVMFVADHKDCEINLVVPDMKFKLHQGDEVLVNMGISANVEMVVCRQGKAGAQQIEVVALQ